MPISVISFGAIFSLLWASAFVAGKIAIQQVDPITLLGPRFLIAGLIMMPAVLIRSGGSVCLDRTFIKDALILGFLCNVAYLGLSFWGLKSISPEATIFIVSMAPLITSVLAMFKGQKYGPVHFAGIAIATGGIYVVLSKRMSGGEDLNGMCFVLAATFAFSLGTIWYGCHAKHHNPVALNCLQNIFAGLMLLPFATELHMMPAALAQSDFALSFIHLIIGVSIIDFLMWLALLRKTDPGTASSFHLLNPIFGIGLAWLIIGGPLLMTDLIGAALVLLGLGLVMRRIPYRPKQISNET